VSVVIVQHARGLAQLLALAREVRLRARELVVGAHGLGDSAR